MRVRTLNQIVKEIQEIDPNTAINKYMLFALIKDRKIPHGNHGNRTVMDFDAVAPSFNELLNFKKGKELPQIRTIRAAVSGLREKYPEFGIGEEQIRACVQEGRISSIVVGNRRYIAMQSFFEPYNERIMSGYSPSVMKKDSISRDVLDQMSAAISRQTIIPKVTRVRAGK